jgi:hypothetical protein
MNGSDQEAARHDASSSLPSIASGAVTDRLARRERQLLEVALRPRLCARPGAGGDDEDNRKESNGHGRLAYRMT